MDRMASIKPAGHRQAGLVSPWLEDRLGWIVSFCPHDHLGKLHVFSPVFPPLCCCSLSFSRPTIPKPIDRFSIPSIARFALIE
jgi:hypothetical protein